MYGIYTGPIIKTKYRLHNRQLLPATSHLLIAPHQNIIMPKIPLSEYLKGEWYLGCY